MHMLDLLAGIVLAYIYGAIPFGLIISKKLGVDITKVGSGNVGTANVYRNLGAKPAIIVFLLDFSKGIFAYLIGVILNSSPLVFEVFSLLGNIHSIFMGFRGGKGFANLLGFVFAYFLTPFPEVLLVLLVIYLTTLLLTGITSLANIFFVLELNLITMLLKAYSPFYIVYLALILYSHRDNVIRLLKRKEHVTFKLWI